MGARMSLAVRIFQHWRWIVLGGLILFVGIQFVPVDTVNPPVEFDIDAEAEVMLVLRQACYDCHSNETTWPWYGKVAPVSWWLADHVEHARGDLNFSSWAALDPAQQAHLREEIAEEVGSGEMPLASYRLLHPQARLNDTQRSLLVDWATRPVPADTEPPQRQQDPGSH